jgi:hypothetical protein
VKAERRERSPEILVESGIRPKPYVPFEKKDSGNGLEYEQEG